MSTFGEVKTNPLSTFGLDVDTASYTTMRRYLTEMKRLPTTVLPTYFSLTH